MIRVFQVYVPASVLGVLFGDIALLLACFSLPAYFTELDASLYLFDEGGLLRSAFVVLCIILGLHYHDLYSNLRIRWRSLLVQQSCVSIGIAFLAQAMLFYVYREWIVPRDVMFYGSALALIALPAWRIGYARLVRSLGAQRLLFLGDSEVVRQVVARLLARPEWGLIPIGYIADGPAPEAPGDPKFPCLGGTGQLRELVTKHQPVRLVVDRKSVV